MSDMNKLKELAMPFKISGWFVNQDEEVVAIDPEAGRDDSGEIFVACANALETARFIAAANPETVIGMIEQLEDGKSFIARQSEIIANQNQRIAELESKTTDAVLREIQAQARAEGIHFAANRMLAAWESGFINDTPAAAYDISGAVLSAVEFLPNADEGEFKRDYADEVRARIRAGEQS